MPMPPAPSRAATLFAWLAALAAPATIAHAETAQRSFAVANFRQVETTGSFDTVITIGPGFKVTATGDKRGLDRLTATVTDGRLILSQKYEGSYDSSRSPQVSIQLPALDAMALKGSGNLEARNVTAGKFTAALSGSGDLKLNGSCKEVALSLQGSGDLDAGKFACEAAAATLAGSGDLTVRASARFSGSLAGSGDIIVLGNPAKRVGNTVGSGDIHYK